MREKSLPSPADRRPKRESLESLHSLVLLAAALGCAPPAGLADGRWVGDLATGGGVERLEIAADSGGRAIAVSAAGWQLAGAAALVRPADADSVELAVPSAAGDTVTLRGRVGEGVFRGVALGRDREGTFELRHLVSLADADWQAAFGTYRADDGALVAVMPFAEFGPAPQVVDYRSGRLGPLFPVATDRFLVGRSLVTPIFPADTLLLRRGANGAVSGVRLIADGGTVDAERLATRDEAVTFRSGEVELHGTLTLPATAPPHPAIVIVHGSGPLTRDHLAPWQRFFAGLGFAALGYDKRGTGRSTGDWMQADFPTLADDVLAGVRHLAARPDIRADRIGLWGASQGGWILPIAAARAPAEIAFLVVHAGTGTTVAEQGRLNLRNEYVFAGAPDTMVALALRYHELDDRVTRTGAGLDQLQRFYDAHAADGELWPPRPLDHPFRPFYRRVMDFDPAPHWARVRAPVILFFGELDANVPPRESWPPIERALRRAGNDRVTHHLLPGANHLLFQARTGARGEYPGLSRWAPGYFDRMAEWLEPWLAGSTSPSEPRRGAPR